MDWLTFISSIVDQIISWPVAVLIIVLLFLRQLRRLIPTLRHARFGGGNYVELDFGEEVEEIEQRADQAQLPTPQVEDERIPLPGTEEAEERQRREVLYSLAETLPSSAVVEAYKAVEEEAAGLAERADVQLTLKRRPMPHLIRVLRNNDLISDEVAEIADSLRHLRNKAAHLREVNISTEEAKEYVDVAQRVAQYFRQG